MATQGLLLTLWSKAEVYVVAFCVTFFWAVSLLNTGLTVTLEWPVSWPCLVYWREAAWEGLREQQNKEGQDRCHRKLDNAREPDFPREAPTTYFTEIWRKLLRTLCCLWTWSLGSSLCLPNSPGQGCPGEHPPVKWFIPFCKEWPPSLGLFHLIFLCAKS